MIDNYLDIEENFEWEVVYSYIDDKNIFRLKDDKDISPHPDFRKYYKPYKYKVFREKNIYEEFSRINIDSLKDIDEFINKRGILGLHIENRNIDLKEEFSQYKNIVEYQASIRDWSNIDKLIQLDNFKNKIIEVSHIETIEGFVKEVKLMRLILLLNSYDTIKTNQELEVKALIKEIEELANVNFITEDPQNIMNNKSSLIVLKHEIMAFIAGIVALKMKNVKPKLSLIYNKDKSYTYIDSWQPKSLLGCMYTMLYNDLSQGYKSARCKVCGNPVILRDSRSEAYHPDCQNKKHVSNTRERQTKEAKKYIVSKYTNSEMATDQIIKVEKPYIDSHIGKSALFNKKRVNEWLERNNKEED